MPIDLAIDDRDLATSNNTSGLALIKTEDDYNSNSNSCLTPSYTPNPSASSSSSSTTLNQFMPNLYNNASSRNSSQITGSSQITNYSLQPPPPPPQQQQQYTHQSLLPQQHLQYNNYHHNPYDPYHNLGIHTNGGGLGTISPIDELNSHHYKNQVCVSHSFFFF